MVGLNNPGVATGCGSRYSVEGVTFCLVPLALDPSATPSALLNQIVQLTTQIEDQLGQLPLLSGLAAQQLRRTIAVNISKVRNSAAHLCFGSETLAAFPTDPFARLTDGASPYQAYGALDTLSTQGGLTASAVPLALLYWTAQGLQFVDMWAVRRRLIQPLVEVLWPLHVGPRRVAEAEAIFLQFQQQLLDMVRLEENLTSITAVSRFRYLPPAGYVPLGTRNFNRDTFFQGLDVERVQVDGAFLRLLVQQSWFLEPVDLTTPPPLRLYEAPGNANYVLFVRAERPPQASQPPPGPTPTPSTGRMDIDVDVSEATTTLGSASISPTQGTRPKVGVDIKVWAEDELGIESLAQFVPTRSGLSILGNKDFEFDKGRARFTIRALPPGAYTVRVRLKGFKEASQKRQLQAGQTLHITFKLVPETKPPGRKVDPPPAIGKGSWIGPHWYDKIGPIEKGLKWPWPPEEIGDFQPVVDPPPEDVVDWLQDWGDWVKQQYPDASVDPGNISIYIAQAHTPDATARNPYAYLVFGDSGAYVPVVLTPVDRTLDRRVSVTKGGLAGVDNDVANRLRDAGVTDLDVLGASWQGLVADALGVSPAAAGSVIGEARTRIDALQGSLQIFSGVDRNLEDGLRAAGINTTVALANADGSLLANQLGAQGVTLAFAQRLVEEARQSVPANSWSLEMGGLGLKDQEIAALQSLGITTQGALKGRATETAEQTRIAGALGISTEALGALVGGIDLDRVAAEVGGTRTVGAPVTSLTGVNRDIARNLARLNIGTIGALARADTHVIAEALGGDLAKAAEIINLAKGRSNLPH
jgi:hypothetical protein